MRRGRPAGRGLFPALLAALCLLFLSACAGYRLGVDAPIVLPAGCRTLAITSVDNPTMEKWLEPRLRAALRDEFTRRGVDWAEPGRADAGLSVRILRWSIQGRVKDVEDNTLKYDVDLHLEASLYTSRENTFVWDSGPVRRTLSFLPGDRETAKTRVLELAVRELADRLGYAF